MKRLIDGQGGEEVNKFKYLEVQITSDGRCELEWPKMHLASVNIC